MTPAEFVAEVVQRQTEWVEGHLRALADGESLCVHEDYSGASYTRLSAHVLEPGPHRSVRVRRTVYGPMTPEIRAAAAGMVRA